jgi:hypothetical protein
MLADRIQDFLRRLKPQTRSNLLAELERLELCGEDMPGTAEVLEKLRAEFRKDGPNQSRIDNPSRFFFAPLEPLLIDGAPEHANSGRILRVSLLPIWEWISRDLLPTMARDYVDEINQLIAANDQREARQAATAFQTKVAKYLEGTLGSPDGVEQTRAKLAIYTASHTAFNDLTKILCVLRARDALAKFNDALPAAIDKFDDARLAKMSQLLATFGKSHADVLDFALALLAGRLRTPSQLIRLATASCKNAADVAATPYAITISMVLDRLDDKRLLLRVSLKNNRVLVARDILTEIYDIEYALRVGINRLDASDWGKRLDTIMDAIAALVETETKGFPSNVRHVLGSSSLRRHRSLAGRLAHLAAKGRDAMSDVRRKLLGRPEEAAG